VYVFCIVTIVRVHVLYCDNSMREKVLKVTAVLSVSNKTLLLVLLHLKPPVILLGFYHYSSKMQTHINTILSSYFS